MDSAGTSARKYALYLDSIEGRMKKMTATYQDFVHTEEFENVIKMIIELANSFGELLNAIGATNIALVAFALSAGAIGTKLIPIITNMAVAMPAVINAIKTGIVAFGGLAAAETAAATAMYTFITTTLPIAGIALAIGGLIYYMFTYKSATEKATDSIKELKSAQEDAEASLESINSQIEENQRRWEELNKAKSNGNNSDIINEEKKALEAQNEVLKVQKEYYEAVADAKKSQAKQEARELLNHTTNQQVGRGVYRQVSDDPISQTDDMISKMEESQAKLISLYKEYGQKTSESDRDKVQKEIDKKVKYLNKLNEQAAKIDINSLLDVFDEADPEYEKIMDANKRLIKSMTSVTKATSVVGSVSEMTEQDVDSLSTSLDESTEAFNSNEDGAVELIGALNETVESFNKIKDAQKELNDEGNLSWNTISGLAEKFPELTSDLLKYTQGVITNAEMSKILNKTLGEQENVFKDNLKSSEKYYEAMVLNNTELYNKFLENYKIDLANFSSISELKLEIDKMNSDSSGKILDQRVSMLAEKYNIDVQNYATAAEAKLKIEQQLLKANAQSMAGKGMMPQLNSGGRLDYKFNDIELSPNQKKDLEALSSPIDNAVSGEIDKLISNINSLAKGVGSKASGSKSKDSKSKEDKWKEAFEKEYKTIQYWRDKEWITQKEYYDRLDKLNIKYFKNREKYIDEFRQYDLEVQNGMLQVYQDEFNKRLELSKNWIEERKYYDDWGSDSEISAWQRVLKWMKEEFYPKNKKEKEIYDKFYKESTKSLISSIEEEFDKGLDSSSHKRNVYEFETGKVDETSIQRDMDKIAEIITRGYYKINGELVDITQQRYESLQDKWMSLHKERLSSLKDEQSEMEDIASVASRIIDKEIEKLEIQKENVESVGQLDNYIIDLNKSKYQALMGNETGVATALQNQIDYIKEQKNIIDKITDGEEKRKKIREVQLEIQNKTVDKLKEELRIIKGQRTQRIYSVERGWEWKSDKQAELNKEQEILEAQTQANVASIETQILNWEDYKKAWEDVVKDYKLEQDKLLLSQKMGKNIESDILNQRIEIVEKFARKYEEIMNRIKESQDIINDASLENVPKDIGRKLDDEGAESDRVQSVKDKMKENAEKWHGSSKDDRDTLSSENQRLGKSIGALYDSYTGAWYYSKDEVMAKMQQNSIDWHNASKSDKNKLSAENQRLGKLIGASYNNGVWTYHNGIENGLVGDVPFDKNTEIIAKLAKGEGVFNKEQMSNIVRNMLAVTGFQSKSSNINSPSNDMNQIIQISNITLPDVRDGNEFLNTMKNIVAITGV